MSRFVVCDDDDIYATIMEAMLTERGHEVVGVAASTSRGVALIESARPDVVIVDSLLGYTSDFNVIKTCNELGITAIVFTSTPEDELFSQYSPPPMIVHKPDLTELERVVDRLGSDDTGATKPQERRQRPNRAVAGPKPTSLNDAHAFYAAFEQATAGDGLVAFDLHHTIPLDDVRFAAESLRQELRDGDRLVVSSTVMRVFVPDAHPDGVTSLLSRLRAGAVLPPGTTTTSIVLSEGETSTEAFERLKHTPPEPHT